MDAGEGLAELELSELARREALTQLLDRLMRGTQGVSLRGLVAELLLAQVLEQ